MKSLDKKKSKLMDWEKELREVIETAASIDDCDDIECGIRYVRSLLSHQRQEILDQVEREVIGLKVIEPPRDVERLKEKRQAFIAGQMNVLLRQNDKFSALRLEGKDKLKIKKEEK